MSNLTKYLGPFRIYINGLLAIGGYNGGYNITGIKIKDGVNGKYLILFSMLTESESNYSFEQGNDYNITIQFLYENNKPTPNHLEIKAICQIIELNAFLALWMGKMF
jgi:hypothetical protein